jgi:succinate dehydrogenase / fumarate reductase iron-sulfur subunit
MVNRRNDMKKHVITAKIQRFNRKVDKAPWYQEYKIEVEDRKSISVLDLVKHIHDKIDRTLAYRNVRCHIGVCTACLMNINGKNLRACSSTVSPGDELTIGPAKKSGPVVRDLVIDFGMMREQEAIDESIEKR